VLGIKYTTARHVAEHAITRAITRIGGMVSPSITATRPFPGDVIRSLAEFRASSLERYSATIPRPAIERLLRLYGCGIDAILVSGDPGPILEGSDDVLAGEIRHVVNTEMPRTLGDLIFRRTGIGSNGAPDPVLVRACAAIMAQAHGWNGDRIEAEVAAVLGTTCLWQAATA
jgi:glycerol-3-phosphate dehydrogenase